MSKDDILRALMHFPVGVYVAWLVTVDPTLCWLLGISFLVYEAMNDWRKKDWSYKDILGFTVGLGVGSFGVFLWGIIGVV